MTFALLAILASAPIAPPPLVEADVTIQRIDPRPGRLKYSGYVVDGYHLVETPNWTAVGTGLAIFGVAYIPWGLMGAALGSPENLVPIIGPALAYRPATGWFSEAGNTLALFFITVDVLTQFAGVTTTVVGLITRRRWLQRNEAAPAISFVPSAAGADIGASVIGRF